MQREPTVPPEPIKHHYVPRSILRHFSIDGKRRNVFVYDKSTKCSFSSPISNAGAEKNFYSFTIAGRKVNFEPFFQQIDDLLASLLSKIARQGSLRSLDTSERYGLAKVTACQLLRTKLQRTSRLEIARQLTHVLKGQGINLSIEMNDEDARLIAFQGLLKLESFGDLLAGKDVLLLNSKEGRFWTSDNPVVLHNTFPEGRRAVAAPGVEIYQPLTPQLCLAFFCPSIREILTESFDPEHPRPETTNPFMQRLLTSLQEDTPLDVPISYSIFLNSLQVRHSSRFLYASQDEFDLAYHILMDHPQFREVRSLVSIGKIGTLPTNPRMPSGTWLAIEVGYRHHMLPVVSVEEGSGGISFLTTDPVKLSLVEREAPFDCVTLFVDRQPVTYMRNVAFCHMERNGSPFVRVQHVDPGLNSLLEKLLS